MRRPLPTLLGSLSLLLLSLAGIRSPAGAVINGSFIVQCAVNHTADVDPIVHPDGSPSHTHDFWGNSLTWPGVSTNQLTAYEADVTALSLTSGPNKATAKATISLPAQVTINPFLVGDTIYVSGVKLQSGALDNDVNSGIASSTHVWTITAVPSATTLKFKVNVNVTRTDLPGSQAALGLSLPTTSRVPYPDPIVTSQGALPRAMSCGGPNPINRGDLTYDSAAYWSPAFYQVTGAPKITPIRSRVYYFPSANCSSQGTPCQTYPAGAQLIGGNSGAASPSANPTLNWSCGHESSFDTPGTDHPYNCDPYLAAALVVSGQNQNVVDGPVGKVGFPSCWNGTGTDYLSFVYENPQGTCPAGFTTPVPRIDFRIHLGAAWNGTTNPCVSSCNAWNIQKLEIDPTDTVAPFSGWITTAAYALNGQGQYCGPPPFPTGCTDYTPQNLTNNELVIVRNTRGWDSPGDDVIGGDFHALLVDNLNHKFYVQNEIPGPSMPNNCIAGPPPQVSPNCGTVGEGALVMNFRVAGTTGGVNDHTHPYYTLHADFWDTWHNTATNAVLTKLISDCINQDLCAQSNIDNNEQVNTLP